MNSDPLMPVLALMTGFFLGVAFAAQIMLWLVAREERRNEREAAAKREALDAVLALRATAELACCVPSADAHDGWMAGVETYAELIEAEIAQQEGFSR